MIKSAKKVAVSSIARDGRLYHRAVKKWLFFFGQPNDNLLHEMQREYDEERGPFLFHPFLKVPAERIKKKSEIVRRG